MPTPASRIRRTSRHTVLHAIAAVLHPYTLIWLWLPGCWFVYELLSVVSLVEMNLLSSLDNFQASPFISR